MISKIVPSLWDIFLLMTIAMIWSSMKLKLSIKIAALIKNFVE